MVITWQLTVHNVISVLLNNISAQNTAETC